MTPELDEALALVPRGAGRFDATLDVGWTVGPAVNGGFLLALLHQAARAAELVPHPDPLVTSAHYVRAAVPGDAELVVEPVRAGRALGTVQVSLTQTGPGGRRHECLRALTTYGDLSRLEGEVATTAAPPDLPPPDRCVGTDLAPPAVVEQVPMLGRLDLRLDPATAGWALGEPSGRGEIRGWLRLADGREPDVAAVLLASDALPPVSFDLGMSGWTPTIELTAHVRARPAPGWLRVRVSTANPAGGLLEEDAEVWDSAGRLVAQARQLAAVPRS